MAVKLGASIVTSMQRAQAASRQIVTPRYEAFLRANREIVYDDWVIDAVTEGLKHRQQSRTGRLGGSSAGSCLRAQVLGYLGAPSHPVSVDLQKIFEDGKWRHMRLQAVLMQAGIVSRVEVPARWRRARAFGQIDGAGIVPMDHPVQEWRGLEFGLEIKGAMSFAYNNIANIGPEKYIEQVARYFLYTGFELFVILVEQKDNQQNLEYVVTEADVNSGRALHELQILNDAIDDQELPPQLSMCSLARGQQFLHCPYGGDVTGACHSYTKEGWS